MVFNDVKSISLNEVEFETTSSYGTISGETDSSLASLDEKVVEAVVGNIDETWRIFVALADLLVGIPSSSSSIGVVAAEVSLFTVGNDLDVVPSAVRSELKGESIGTDEEAGNSSDVDLPSALSIVGVGARPAVSDWRRECLELGDSATTVGECRGLSGVVAVGTVVRHGSVVRGVRGRSAGNQGEELKCKLV